MNAGPSPVRQGHRAVAGITASIASITAVVGLSALKEGVVTRAPAELRRLGVATSLAAAGMKCRMFNMIAR
jgi:hypothetical protein